MRTDALQQCELLAKAVQQRHKHAVVHGYEADDGRDVEDCTKGQGRCVSKYCNPCSKL